MKLGTNQLSGRIFLPMATHKPTLEYLATTKIGEKGQLTVPKQFREDLGLGNGAPFARAQQQLTGLRGIVKYLQGTSLMDWICGLGA
jgi:hypothetical protein